MSKIRQIRADEVMGVIAENRELMLVHFGSPLASSCDFVHKQLELLAPLFEGRLGIVEVEVPLQDVEVLRRYEIEEIPTLIVFRGEGEVERLESILLPEELREFLETCCSFYAGHGPPDELE